MELEGFPFPLKKDDIYLTESIYSEEYIFSLLSSDDKVIIDKSCSIPSEDGSAKNSVKLVFINNLVFKSNIASKNTDIEAVKKEIGRNCSLAKRTRVSHPDKSWFVVKKNDSFYQCSVCPELTTVHNASDGLFIRHLLEMVKIGITVIKTFELHLDLNPSNFGYLNEDVFRLYYIDDEIYNGGDLRSVGEFLINRIRNHPEISPEQWRSFGVDVSSMTEDFCLGYHEIIPLFEGIEDFPLSEIFSEKRDSLLAGLKANYKPRRAGNHQKIKTCVMADIHSNLPAIESVYKEACSLGANKFVILGDIVGYGPFPKETMELVFNMPNLIVIQGNHDYIIGAKKLDPNMNKMGAEAAEWTMAQLSDYEANLLENLDRSYIQEEFMFVHGSLIDPEYIYAYIYEMNYEDNLTRAYDSGLKTVFFGHTHFPCVYSYLTKKALYLKEKITEELELFADNKISLINPGSVGQPRDRSHRPSFCIWDQTAKTLSFHRTDYDIDKTIYRLKELNFKNDPSERLKRGI